MLYIFPALSLCLINLYNSFSPSFDYNRAYKSSYARPIAIATAFFALLFFFVDLFSIFISYFVPCFLGLFLFFMLSCTFSFHHHVSLSPFRFPNVTPSTVSAVFLGISAVLSHSSGNPSMPPKILVTSCLNAS